LRNNFNDSDVVGFTLNNFQTSNKSSACQDVNILGGYQIFGSNANIKKTYQLPEAHNKIIFLITVYYLDNIDNIQDNFKILLDNKEIYTSPSTAAGTRSQICGGTDDDEIQNLKFNLAHSGATLDFEFQGQINSGGDPTFGIRDINIISYKEAVYQDLEWTSDLTWNATNDSIHALKSS